MGTSLKDEVNRLRMALSKERRLRKEAEDQCVKLIACLDANNRETQSLREAVRRKAKVTTRRDNWHSTNPQSDGLVVDGSCND